MDATAVLFTSMEASDMGEIQVQKQTFSVEVLSRNRFTPTYVLNIQLQNPNEVEFPRHELSKVLNVGRRREITDEKLKKVLSKWSERHPNAEMIGFGVTEEWPCRGADKVRDGGNNVE